MNTYSLRKYPRSAFQAFHRRPAGGSGRCQIRDRLHGYCELPRTLKETGKVQLDQFEAIASATLNDGSVVFNAREVEFDDAMKLLEAAWD